MSIPIGDGDFLHEFEIEVQAELNLAASSRPEETTDLPVSQWLFDPIDVERYEVGLRDLLGAAEVLEGDGRPDEGA